MPKLLKPFVAPDGHPKRVNSWLEPRGCGNCDHCGIEPQDMDPTCFHPNVVKVHRHGLHIDPAIRNYCGNPHTLWKKRRAVHGQPA